MTQAVTPQEALHWLEGLKKPCPNCYPVPGVETYPIPHCKDCGGTGKVPVLDLREPCPGSTTIISGSYRYPCLINGFAWWKSNGPPFEGLTDPCEGRGWIPKQGREALHEAMLKDGWYYTIYQENIRTVVFWRWVETRPPVLTEEGGSDSDDYISAYKAMKAAGYS